MKSIFSKLGQQSFTKKTRQTVIRPILKPDFPPLHAVNLVSEDQTKLLRGFLEAKQTAHNLGKTLFSLHQANDYFQRTWGMSWELRHYLWLFMFAVCAWVNVQAVKATVDNNLPAQLYQWKPSITFAFSACLVFLLDWLIGSELKNFLSRFDAQQLLTKLENLLEPAQGELNKALAAGKIEAFERVQGRYLAHVRFLTWLKLLLLAIVYLIEIRAAIYSIEFYGESEDVTAYIAPLLGVLLSGLSGLFRALTIEYAKRRHGISYRYLDLAEEESHEELIKDILLANTMTEVFLRNGEISRELVEKIKQEIRQAELKASLEQEVYKISDNYHDSTIAVKDKYRQELDELETEHQRLESSRSLQDSASQQQKFHQHKNRLGRKHFNNLIGLVEEAQQDLKRVYRQHPYQLEIYFQFQQELNESKQEYQTQLDRLELEWQVINNPQSDSRVPDQFKQSPDDEERKDKPFDFS